MPPLQKNKKIKQTNQIDNLLLPVTGMVFSRKLISKEKPEESTIDFHLEVINKIDKLLKEHESETFSLDSITEQQTCNSPEELPVEVRDPLSKKIGLSEVKLGTKPDDIFTNRETMPEEIKTDLLVTNSLDSKEDILPIKETENERIEIINLGSLSEGDITSQKFLTLLLNGNYVVEHQTSNISKNRSGFDTIPSKKVEFIDAKELGNKKCDNVFSKMKQQPKEKERKAQVYYLDGNRRQKESRFKVSESERLHIPENFGDKLKELEEKEEEIKRKKKELKEKEKEVKLKRQEREKIEKGREEEKLNKLELKKAMMEAKEEERAAEKVKKEKEAKLKRREKELREKAREEEKLKKLELKKAMIVVREKEKAIKKAEKEKLAELKRQEMEQRAKEKEAKKSKKMTATIKKHKRRSNVKNPLFFFKKEKKRGHKKKLNWGMKKKRETDKKKIFKIKDTKKEEDEKKDKKQEPTLLDEDVKQLLVITDNLLGELPEEAIDKFAQSKDFELYSKVLSKYKIK